MANILDNVALSVGGAYATTTYRQRPQLQETWEAGSQAAVELLDCDHGDSNSFIRNTLGTVWLNRNRTSGVSRVVPKQYTYRKGCYGSVAPTVFTDIPSYTGATYPAQIRAYGRPWYAFKMDLVDTDGVPLQWQAASSDVAAGDLRWIAEAPTSLTASQISGGTAVTDGRERYNVHYKPFRYMVLSDTDQSTIWAANADSAGTELQRYVIREYHFAAKNLTLPPNWLYWASDLNTGTGALTAGKVAIPEGATKLFPTINVLMTWVDVPWIPVAAIQSCLGKVNAITTTTSANADGNWDYQPTIDGTNMPLRFHKGWAPGTLLFDAVHDVVEHTNAAGQWVMDITYSFVYRSTGWNKFLRYETNTFETVVTKESINQAQANWKYLYESADFNSLFKLPVV